MSFSDRNEVSSRLGLVRRPVVGPYGTSGPYSLGDLGAFAPRDGQVPGTAAVPARRGFSGLGDLSTLYSAYKPWLWIVGAIVGLIYAKKAGWISDEG